MNSLFKGIDPHKTGTHKFPFVAALHCKEAGLTEEQAKQLIEAEEHNMPRPFKSGEAAEAIGSAYGSSDKKTTTPKWPEVDKDKQRKIINANKHVTVAVLQQCSPEAVNQGPAAILQKLFPGDPLICVSKEFDSGTYTAAITRFMVRNPYLLMTASFVVPSAMEKGWGYTKTGDVSVRCLDNTGPRQHIIVEIDDKSISKDQQVAILNHLAQFAPLVMVVDSGNKSLHGWFACHGVAELQLAAFFKEAVSLGADPAAWTRCQLVRMPNGIRRFKDDRGSRKQSLIYCNPAHGGIPVVPVIKN